MSQKKKIMVLEDDDAVADLMKYYFEEKGYQVKVSLTAAGFIDSVATFEPDLITLDILLPDTNGFDVFRELKMDKRTKDIPIVFVSVREADKDRGLEMGAKGFVVKPFNEGDLIKTIDDVWGKETG